MIPVSLHKLVSRRRISKVIDDILSALDTQVSIVDNADNLLKGVGSNREANRFPILLEGEELGWVYGDEKAAAVASMLNHLAVMEFEKKTLAQETLDKYKEISLLHSLADRMTTCLDTREVVRLVMDEAKKMVHADFGSIRLLSEKTGTIDVVGAFGDACNQIKTLRSGEGIEGSVFLSGKAEIVNEIPSDPRYTEGEVNGLQSMMCAPLRTVDREIGVITVGSRSQHTYTSGDLKMFTALTLQASSSIENAVFHENKLREERIKNNLERYIAPQIVTAILQERGDFPLIPLRRNIAILFSDIRNFSRTCEEMLPEKIVGYLNEYFTKMVDIIFQHGGTLNKFVGDMIFAFFGAPAPFADNEKRTIDSAVEMQKSMKTIPDAWIRDNFNTGIGISSGEVVVGNIGSPKHMDYTAIGDEVNIAERLQARADGGQILVSRKVYEKTKNIFTFRNRGFAKVKGKEQEVEVFEVVY